MIPDFGPPRGTISQFTSIDVNTGGMLFVSEENYRGDANGIPSYTPPTTTFNPAPGVITGRIYFDRVLISSSLILPVHNLNQDTYYLTIQAGVNAANPGDVLECEPWTFNERVTVNKSLTIQGTDMNTCIVDGTGLAGVGSGFYINAGIVNVIIKNFTIKNFAGTSPNGYAGVYASGGNNNLTVNSNIIKDNVGGSGIYANGPVNTVMIDGNTISGHTNAFGAARGIVIWNGLKQNITITNNEVFNNNCCGIELQDGTGTGVVVSNNNVHDNGDNGIGLGGLMGPGANVISANAVANNGRFGIEIKNPDGNGNNGGAGSVVVSGNTVSRTAAIVDARDIAGIAVFRRGVLAENVDVPRGVYVVNNAVSGYAQTSASDGFGIVMEGINHTVSTNSVSGNDVGIQRQAGHLPYPGDGDQSNLSDLYFGRGNSPITCGVTLTGNILSNTVDTRDVGNAGGTGIVTNTNTGESFCTIQAAIDDAQTLTGHTISVGSGTYDEQVKINKSLTILGAGATQPVINYTGVVSGKPTLFDISADAVTIDNIHFNVDLAKLKSAIIASAPGIDNITVQNNVVDAYGTPSSGTYSDRNAVSINYGGSTNYRVATGGVNNIIYQNNTVNGNMPVSYFRAGVAVDEGGGTFTGNTSQVINHDVLVRFGSNGPVHVTNNTFNGGGVELNDMNAGAGTLTVAGNTFDATFANTAAPGAAVLRLRNNFHGKATNVSGNTFSNHQWAVSLENYNSVTVNENVFTPLAGSSTFHHVTVNTKLIATNSSSVTQVTITADIRNNIFNGSGSAGGSGVTFLNHDMNAASFGAFNVNENSFDLSIANAIEQDGQSGPSSGSTFPAYTPLIGSGGGAITTMAPWTAPINGSCNWYGTTTSSTIASKVGPDVTYTLFLIDGTDNSAAIGFQPVPGSCAGPVPRLSTTINGVTVTSNANGLPDDNGTVVLCNTPNNLTYDAFTDVNNATPVSKVRAWQELVSQTNVTTSLCNNCSAQVTAYPGTTGNVSLVNPLMSGTLVIRYKAFFDADGDMAISPGEPVDDWVTYTVHVDGEAPELTGTLPGGDVGSVCKANAPAAPPAATIAAQYTDALNNGVIAMMTGSSVTGTDCEWTAAYTYSVKDNCGNMAPDAVVEYTGGDNTAPTFTRPADITIYTTAACSYDAGVAATGDVTNEADNCSTGLNATFSDVNVAGPCEGSRVITRTWSLVDNCGNPAADQVQTITVSDNTAPTFSRPADITIYTTAACSYDAGVAATGDVTNEADNCSTGLNATFSDVNVAGPCEGSRVITRTWSLVDNCGNPAADQVQTITVSDNTAPTFSRPADITFIPRLPVVMMQALQPPAM